LTHVKDLADDISSMAGLQEQLLRSKTMKHCATIFKKKRITECILDISGEEIWEMRL
jgi:hypothetical protein